jgi:hypothetical protein
MTDVWQPNTSYEPDDEVVRATVPPVTVTPPTNASFDEGDTGWTKETSWTIEIPGDGNTFDGTYAAKLVQSNGLYRTINVTQLYPVLPEQVITAKCEVMQGGANRGQAGAKVYLEWLNASQLEISSNEGNLIDSGSGGNWQTSSVTATAPAGAAFVRIGATGFQKTDQHSLWVDKFRWNYSYRSPFLNLIYRNIGTVAGVSGSTEPIWPETEGSSVVDGGVEWQPVYGSSVEWEAVPLLVSGNTEPAWPLGVGASVKDGTIIWTAVSRRVEDVRCPNSKVVAISSSKIFAGSNDIIAYSATVNPLDWTTADDAGYLPFGLNTHGANPVSAMGLYRGNLVAFNSAGFQMWQVDEDPLNMALLDAAPIGCTEPRSVQPLQNDLVFLSAVGVRNISIAGASTNLQAGSTGEPIDTLVTPLLRSGEYEPISAFIPAYGQYWCIFGPEAFVLTLNQGKVGKWSRYEFPEPIVDTTLLGKDLYLRTESHKILRVTEDYLVDDYNVDDGGVEFYGVVHWPHLDFGLLGIDKQFIGFDLVASAPDGVSISVGYDQRDLTARTEDFEMESDTLPGRLVPIPMTAPSFDFRLTFNPNQEWEWFASVLYYNVLRPTA